jgi:hypothetical protein
MNKIKASVVVMSYLSDTQELIIHMDGRGAKERINFAKYVIMKTGGDLTQEIDPDKLWSEFVRN